MSKPREFWIYSNDEHSATFACDFNQRGFISSNVYNPIRAIEFPVYEQAQKEIAELKAKLKARDALIDWVFEKNQDIEITDKILLAMSGTEQVNAKED